MVVVYERENRFRKDTAQEMVRGLLEAFDSVGPCSCYEMAPIHVLTLYLPGIRVDERDPLIFHPSSSARIGDVRSSATTCP